MPLLDKKDIFGLMEREIVLLYGKPGSGKSYSVARMLEQLVEQEKRVLILDRGNGLAKAFGEVFGKKKLPDFDYFLVKTWQDLIDGITLAFDTLGSGDWLVFEEASKMWDLAQSEFSRQVYDGSKAMHALTLRAKAEELIAESIDEDDLTDDAAKKEMRRIRKREIGFGGFSGENDWGWIKELHNDDVFDAAIVNGQFNVLTTTSAVTMSTFDQDNARLADYLYLGVRPGGEKDQAHRHNSTLFLYQDAAGQYAWRTDLGGGAGKDRGYVLVKDQLCPDLGALVGWLDHHTIADNGGK